MLKSLYRFAVCFLCISLFHVDMVPAEQVRVRYREGVSHGFLALRELSGKTLAIGDLIQIAKGDKVTSELVFHFKDGSIHDETTIFLQRDNFRLLSDHLVQNGPSFPHPTEVWVDCIKAEVSVRYQDGGNEKTATEQLEIPDDVANGLVLTLVKNIQADAPQTTVSMVTAAPKPRVVKLVIKPAGEAPFRIEGASRKAIDLAVKVEIGGVAGAVAPLVGKQPPEMHVWVFLRKTPTFLRFEGPLYQGGPIWRIDPVDPTWPRPVSKTKR